MSFNFPSQNFIKVRNQTANLVLNLFDSWVLHHPSIVRDKKKNHVLNTRSRVAMLTMAVRYSSKDIVSVGYRIGRDNTKQKTANYYRCLSTVVQEIRWFFKEYPDYDLLVDACSLHHQAGMYITCKRFPGQRGPVYTVHAFDPNNGQICSNIINVVKQLSATIEKVPVWTTNINNDDDLCFALTW